MSNIKRLFFDIEVSPNIGFFWNPGHRISIGYENIIKERAIICICYKWAGQNKTYYLQWDNKQNDAKMLKQFIRIANQADELVGHNGDNFDLKWIRTRCLFHDIDMMPTYTSIDTLKESRKLFRFNSNRLDYISKYVGLKGKTETTYDLWKDITLKNCKKSLRKMVAYCKNDVVQLEDTFNRLNKYIKPKSSIAEYRSNCPECNSHDTRVVNNRITATGTMKVQFQCNDCGKYHTIPAKTFDKEIRLREKHNSK